MNKNYSIVIALMMFFNLSLFSQDGPPWDFNGTDHGFVASNYTALAVGDTYLTYSINSPNDDGNGGSSNPNFKNENAMMDTSAGNFIAVTMQNLTANTRIVVILTKNGNNTYTNFDGLTPNDEGFVTHYINVGGSNNWSGTVDAVNFRFKQGGGVNNNVFAGDILFDHIEIVEAIPSTPRTDYTFDDPSDAEGFVGGNGVSLSQPNAGSIVANISANSPYPKFEQSGLYSVDADAYKYVEINLTNNSPKNRITFVSPNGGNQFSGAEMAQGEQLIYLNLSEMTNWNGTYSNWWLQLVENPGDGPVASAGEVIIDRILFTDVNNAPMPFHDVTFNLDARNIIVADDGIYMGGGIFNSAQGVAMSDDDGDGIWTAVVTLQEGTTGEFIFLNSPGDGGDYNGRTENLADTACATGQYNDRAIPAFDADNLVFNYCFSVCNDTNTGCAEAATRHDVSFTVGTANIEGGVGEGGMYLGGGIMGHAKAFAMTDNGDDTHSVTVSVPEGLGGNYVFLNNPSNHYWYDGKEDLAGLDCADGEFSDRYLEPVTEAGSVSFCYGTCDTECAAPNNGIAEFPACFDFEGEAGLDGWQFLDLADGTVGWALASASTSSSAFEGGQALYHGYLPAATNYSGLAISPQFNTSGMTDAQLSYTEFVQWASDGQDAVVWVSTDEVLSLESDNLTVVAQGISADGYTDQVIDLPEADYVTVIFQYIGTYGHSWAIDDMCVEEVPAEPNLVTADPTYEWGGYMVVFDVDGNYVFESGWDVADLQTTLNPDAPNIILEPNFNAYDADDPFWSNGEVGNKIMLATTQVESSELYNGADLTFSGSVYEHTLGEDYEAVYFIKCLDQSAGYSDMLNAEYEIPLPESGEFSVTVSGDLLPAGKLVQFGFYVQGLNANPALEYGRVVIGEPGLSIGENNSLDMVIYPNPVDGDYVTIQTPLNGDKLVEVFDVNGRKVMERLLTTDTLNVSSISAGMYIVKVTVEDQSNVSKLIIE